ncbi:terminal uridylyltransferase 4-like [Cloeon dipterum]|uniref:terminal uridylyltransferase 4-like n=1 Tax=Cloeon dipterum TaxID=197152 RepID=UPI00321F73BD
MNGKAPSEEARSRRPPGRPGEPTSIARRQNHPQPAQKKAPVDSGGGKQAAHADDQLIVRKNPGLLHQPKCVESQPLQPPKLDVPKQIWLESNFLVTLIKRASQHPHAQFYCRLCNYYCMSFNHCEQHAQEQKHSNNMKAEAKLTTIAHLPIPVESHFEALTALLSETYHKEGLTEADIQNRSIFASQINNLISENLPGCGVQMYGSSLTGIALKKADLNLDFIVAKELLAPDMLQQALQVLSASDLTKEVESDFNNDIPSILFKNKSGSLNCVLSLNHHDATNTCKLVAMYTKIDPRVKPLGSCFRLWTKLCKIDDTQMAMLPSYSYSLLLVYFLQQLQSPVLPVIKDIQDGIPDWKSKNDMSLGELWYRMFKFYAIEFPETKNCVCIRAKELVTKSDKHWNSRKIAIEDPYLSKRNVSRYLVSTTYDYIMTCFLDAYQYFAVPQTDVGPLLGTIKLPLERFMHIPEMQLNMVRAEQGAIDMMDRDVKHFYASNESKKVYSVEELEKGLDKMGIKEELRYGFYASKIVSPRVAQAMCLRLRKEVYRFSFDPKRFAQDVPVVCNICLMEGHTRNDCPDTFLPPLQDLPPMSTKFLRELDTICKQEMLNWLPSDEEVMERQSFVKSLQEHLKQKFPFVQLELFGSSCNGFGFKQSDLDINLTFTNNATGEGNTDIGFFDELSNELKTYEHIQNMLTITTAKVPIIKFTYPRIRVECDISLYNSLAERNTKMLQLYTQIDPRVKILGYTLKRFAKLCDICDASRGSLSSYAYILMAIYFLQQCEPPVIPVLQELYKGDTAPEVLIDGWNTWFFDDLDSLHEVWPAYGQNTTSVGELWYELLKFYTEEFDYNEHVISIRQKKKLLRFRKLWTNKCIAIEDPFDLSHNLGSGLSRKMNNFIIKAFRKGRMHFGTPVTKQDIYTAYRSVGDYLFDPRYLTEGQVPNDRGCRICKKIGHLARNCPRQPPAPQPRSKSHKSNKQQQQPRREVTENRNIPERTNFQAPRRENTESQSTPDRSHALRAPAGQRMGPPPLMQPFGKTGNTVVQPFQQVNGGLGTPSPPLPPSPTKGLPGPSNANSSPAFDNFMRLMQQRGAPSLMQVPPGFAPQRPPQPPQPHFFHPQAGQMGSGGGGGGGPPANQHAFPNGMPPNPFPPQFFSGAPVAHQMNWHPSAGMQGGQQPNNVMFPHGPPRVMGPPQAMPPQQ